MKATDNQLPVFLKNIEFPRFLFAWAVAAFHLNNVHYFHSETLEDLHKTYFHMGGVSVYPFFIIAFFFLTLKINPEQRLFPFIVSKWMRMAPLFIVGTVSAYLLHKIGLMNRAIEWNSEIESQLLVNEYVSSSPANMYNPAYWFCAAYMIIAVFYLGIIKALPSKALPLIIGVISYLAWRYFMLSGDSYIEQNLWGTRRMSLALFCLGLGYMLSHAYQNKYRGEIYGTSKYWRWLFLSFINRLGWLSIVLDRSWCVCLGRYTFAIYALHPLVLYAAYTYYIPERQKIVDDYPCLFLCTLALLIMFIAVIGHHFVEKPVMKYIIHKHMA